MFLNEIRRRKYKGLKDDIRVLTFYLMGDKSFDILKIVAGFSIKERLKMYCDEVERREKEGTTEDDE